MQISFLSKAIVTTLSIILASGCVSEYDEKRANMIITALPTEVADCTFLGELDTPGYTMIGAARFNLKLQAANLNATHLVETHAYSFPMVGRLLGVALSGRAYRCPVGKGPILPNEEANLKYDFPMMMPEYDTGNRIR
jgi:hypothetical protein